MIVLRGTNLSAEEHEMLVLQLAPGYTTADLLRASGPDLPREVTFIGAATDSEGNVLNDPAFLFDFRCDRPVQSFGITLDDLQVRDCKDAAGNVCRVFSTRSPSDTAVFLTPVPANESWSFQI